MLNIAKRFWLHTITCEGDLKSRWIQHVLWVRKRHNQFLISGLVYYVTAVLRDRLSRYDSAIRQLVLDKRRLRWWRTLTSKNKHYDVLCNWILWPKACLVSFILHSNYCLVTDFLQESCHLCLRKRADYVINLTCNRYINKVEGSYIFERF